MFIKSTLTIVSAGIVVTTHGINLLNEVDNAAISDMNYLDEGGDVMNNFAQIDVERRKNRHANRDS